jgi:succinate-acetate transporter protein
MEDYAGAHFFAYGVFWKRLLLTSHVCMSVSCQLEKHQSDEITKT